MLPAPVMIGYRVVMESAEILVEHMSKDVFLRLVVEVDRSLGDAGALGDAVNRGPRQPVLTEPLTGGVEELRPPEVGDDVCLAWLCCRTHMSCRMTNGSVRWTV